MSFIVAIRGDLRILHNGSIRTPALAPPQFHEGSADAVDPSLSSVSGSADAKALDNVIIAPAVNPPMVNSNRLAGASTSPARRLARQQRRIGNAKRRWTVIS